MEGELRLRTAHYADADVQALVEAVQQEYVVRYGSPDETPLEQEMFDPPRGLFAVGQVDGQAVASGAWRMRSDPVLPAPLCAEVKRMYVRPGFRGRGYARAVLGYLEGTARQAGAHWMVLETGMEQPEAIGLYTSSGYQPVTPFGHYRDSPLVRCYGRPL